MASTALEMIRGTTWQQAFIYKNEDQTPIDLTGYSASFTIVHLMTLSTEEGNITITPLSGQIDLRLDYTVTAQLRAGVYNYYLTITGPQDPVPIVDRILDGRITIKSEECC